MPDTASITTIKKFTYRGKDEEWSNTYHFTGTTPASDAAWKTLADALIAAEKKVYPSSTTVVRVYGYAPGNEHAVAIIDYAAAPLTPVPGTMVNTNSSYQIQAPDTAVWLRGRTPNRNSRGKWIYTRKYFHACAANSAGVIDPYQVDLLRDFGNLLIGGTLPGGFKWCAPQGALATVVEPGKYATTRTLKRRGKRPSS